jgi:protoheme IX farnesyltransferase
MTSAVIPRPTAFRFHRFLSLAKPRVVSLIVFTAMIGMLLATPGAVSLQPFLFGALGIALVAGSAAACNCLLERKIDARMARTRARPLARGDLRSGEALAFAVALGAGGLVLLYVFVNSLTMWLTLATFVAYAVVYTLILKPRTPWNIVGRSYRDAPPSKAKQKRSARSCVSHVVPA